MEKKINILLGITILLLLISFYTLFQIQQKEYVESSVSSDLSYVSFHLITKDIYHKLLEQGETFLIYFRSDQCSACRQADQFVYEYLEKGYGALYPFYIAQKEYAYELFVDETISLEVTPTLIYYDKNQILRKQEGVQEVYELLDEMVRSVS